MLKKRSRNSLCEALSHSERILISTVHWTMSIVHSAKSIIVIHAKQILANIELYKVVYKHDFYDEIRRAIETIPHYIILTIIGDFNA